ncbi:hypothetical protein H0H92_012311 [Tricholoma furcatifolium]|nr:hypothetical protein H0H92_012311 [Tricholoma furcatifolium]
MSEPSLKRKRPPTFTHLPEKRAKKLKQAWVQNQKIKSKWKAQKRREGTFTEPTTNLEQIDNDLEDGSASESGSEASKEEEEEEEKEAASEVEEKPTAKKSTLHPSRAHIHPELAPKKKHPKVPEPDDSEQLSLRELTRRAYSRESLHTFKAGDRRGGARGRGRGRGGPRGETGRGQPNMKLRMDAMLGKIKQSMS